MLLIQALRKQRQMNLFEYQASLFYTVISKEQVHKGTRVRISEPPSDLSVQTPHSSTQIHTQTHRQTDTHTPETRASSPSFPCPSHLPRVPVTGRDVPGYN